MIITRKNVVKKQLPTLTTTRRSAWRRDLPSCLSTPAAWGQGAISAGWFAERRAEERRGRFADDHGVSPSQTRYDARSSLVQVRACPGRGEVAD